MKTSQSTTTSAIAILAITALLLAGCANVKRPGPGQFDPIATSGAQNNQDGSSTSSDQDGSSTSSDVVQIPEGEITVEVFTASDLDQSVGPIIETTLLAAAELWGLYWPVEYWVMGLDPEAGQELVEQYCQRRDEAGQYDYSDCMDREAGDEQYSMISYQREGAEALASGETYDSATLAAYHGDANWGIHRFASSIPWGLIGYFNLSGEDDIRILFHEYWHAVQSSFIQTLDGYQREQLMLPIWFREGGAEYMAHIGMAALRAEGKLPEVPGGYRPIEFEEEMSGALRLLEERFSGDCEGRELTSITEYSDPCWKLAYPAGAWAIAYLLDQAAGKTLLADFYPTLEEKGWQQAFEDFAGMSLAEFNDDFTKFIEKTTPERLAILPSF